MLVYMLLSTGVCGLVPSQQTAQCANARPQAEFDGHRHDQAANDRDRS
jgi:hypothetical protein